VTKSGIGPKAFSSHNRIPVAKATTTTANAYRATVLGHFLPLPMAIFALIFIAINYTKYEEEIVIIF
jgi:hypothetical protein